MSISEKVVARNDR